MMRARMAPNDWTGLSWTPASPALPWLLERVEWMAQRARGFELAVEEAGEEPRSRAAPVLAEWERLVAQVWLYAGLGEARQMSEEDVPAHAEELAKVWANLCELREQALASMGVGAGSVRERERTVRVDEVQVRQRAGELPSFEDPGLPGSVPPPLEPEVRPVSADEVRQRLDHEARPLPQPFTLEAVVAALPPPWVATIHETLGLQLEESPDEEEGTSPVKQQREEVCAALGQPDFLREVVSSLGEEERALLEALLASAEGLRYGDATARFGMDDADGFYWSERPASGPVARLRRLGLAVVARHEGRQVLAIPADLAAALQGGPREPV
jgi:hypothetical protein